MKRSVLMIMMVLLLAVGVKLVYDKMGFITGMEYPMQIGVGHSFGVNADPNLNYGKMPAGAAVTKKINIENNRNFTVRVVLNPTGNISPMISLQREHVLQAGEKVTIPVRAALSPKLKRGDFAGEMELKIYKDK